MRFFFVGLTFILTSYVSLSQTLLKGQIVNNQNLPIPYAHIGIPGENVGTASFEDGTFALSIPGHLTTTDLKISAIGYSESSVNLGNINLNERLVIRLDEKVTVLNEVVVSNKKKKEVTIFKTEKRKGGGHTWFGDGGGGTEMFTKVNVEEGLYELSQVNLRIGNNNVPKFKIRFNFYLINEVGEPGDRLIEESFIVESSVKKGIVKFEFDSKKVWIEEDFYMGFEWIISAEQRANQLATVINWTDYGVPTELGDNTLSYEAGKRIVITNPDLEEVQSIPLTKKQSKEIKAKYDARQMTYLDMSGNHGSLYRLRS